ncbi:hypothetical protein SAMN05192585_10140 [Acetanaerobacterium elongatum]|uniref:Uncharacterized protein n=1 Tax=Acetanaerobacterium elongatum TaxID=258515 RepID=A0A1G9U0H2_9FIRM|nr:hypothetical protein SAMN05192585_10140 [Acetanaerobacterium elongatum]
MSYVYQQSFFFIRKIIRRIPDKNLGLFTTITFMLSPL